MRIPRIYLPLLLLMAGCATTTPLRVQVTPMGKESPAATKNYPYVLPRTVLTVEITYEEQRSVPGPYAEFAERYLGIGEVIRRPSVSWRIKDIDVIPHAEPDPEQYYVVNILEGEMDGNALAEAVHKGVLMDESKLVRKAVEGISLEGVAENNYTRYEELGIYGNFEERVETMYKTIVTDSSYVRVPVERTVVEQKSPAMKAEEAAEYILELRTRRFEMLTGEYEVYPDGEAMGAAIDKLDRIEAAYMSLFTGKTLSRTLKRAYFVIPDPGFEPSAYRLGFFAEQLGFVPEELREGEPLELHLVPLDHPSGNERLPDRLYYRWPGVVEMQVRLGPLLLNERRISVYQAGRFVSVPVR